VAGFWLLCTGVVVFGALRGLPAVIVLAPLLLLLAYGTWVRWRWVLVFDLIVLGGQLVGAVGSAIELARGGADKAALLRPTGVPPVYGSLLNLAISLLAVGLFGWALARLAGARPKSPR
jgi:hypothetical protein